MTARSARSWLLDAAALAFLAAGVVAPAAPAGEFKVKLTVTERAGVRRVAEPVTSGLPLPKGAFKDTRKFAVLDAAGKPVAAQFTVLGRWPSDGSIRWVLLDFDADVEANDTKTFTFTEGKSTPPGVAPVVRAKDGCALVDTGPLRFKVSGAGFRLLEDIEVRDAEGNWVELSGKGRAGAVLRESGGGAFASAGEERAKIEIEESGPRRAVLKVSGAHRNKKGGKLFDFVARIHCYPGKPWVKLQYVFSYAQGASMKAEKRIEDISLLLPLSLGADKKVTFGGSKKPHSGALGGGAKLVMDTSDHYALSGSLRGEGVGKSRKPGTLGWVHVQGANGGAAAAVRWFWQLYPKGLEATPSGLRVALWPGEARPPLSFYPGMSKTHEVLFCFHAPGADAAVVRSTLQGFQQPLFAQAPKAWYCQETGAFGRFLIDNDPARLKPEYRGASAAFDRLAAEWVKGIIEARDPVRLKKLGIDAYGMVNFGDGFHYRDGPDDDFKSVQWDNCYYGYCHALATHFARTGDHLYLRTLREAATHLMDIDIACYSPGPGGEGSPRVCPGFYHVGGFGKFDPRRFRGIWTFYKNAGLLDLYFLTGDRRARDVALVSLSRSKRLDMYDMPRNSRSVGHGLRNLTWGYCATGDKDYLRVCRWAMRRAERHLEAYGTLLYIQQGKGAFQASVMIEGLALYYEATGDRRALPFLKKALHDLVKHNGTGMYMGFGVLYLAGLSADEEMTRRGAAGFVRSVLRTRARKGSMGIKHFGMFMRSAPLAFAFLTEDPPDPRRAARVDIGPELAEARVEVPAGGAVKIDGRLKAEEWKGAAQLVFTRTALPGRPAVEKGTARLLCDAEALYIGVECMESQMKMLRADVKDPSGGIWGDDCIEIYIDQRYKGNGCAKLVANALGVIREGRRDNYPRIEAGLGSTAAAWRGEDRWQLEVRVPFEKLGGRPKPGAKWYFNIVRVRQGEPGKRTEVTSWHGSLNHPESLGTVVFR